MSFHRRINSIILVRSNHLLVDIRIGDDEKTNNNNENKTDNKKKKEVRLSRLWYGTCNDE